MWCFIRRFWIPILVLVLIFPYGWIKDQISPPPPYQSPYNSAQAPSQTPNPGDLAWSVDNVLYEYVSGNTATSGFTPAAAPHNFCRVQLAPNSLIGTYYVYAHRSADGVCHVEAPTSLGPASTLNDAYLTWLDPISHLVLKVDKEKVRQPQANAFCSSKTDDWRTIDLDSKSGGEFFTDGGYQCFGTAAAAAGLALPNPKIKTVQASIKAFMASVAFEAAGLPLCTQVYVNCQTI